MGRYAVVDGDGLVTNVVEWDGETEYDPGEGLELVEVEEDAIANPGVTIHNSRARKAETRWVNPDPEPSEVQEAEDQEGGQ